MSGARAIVEARIEAAADLLACRHEAFVADPGDVETNHKLRVSIRTLRSLVAFIEPWQKGKQNKRVQRKLKKVVARTSRLRELDVLAALGRKVRPDDAELAAFLESEAAAERAGVHEFLSSDETRERLTSVGEDLHALKWRRDFVATDAQERFSELARGLQEDIDRLDESDYEHVHSVRKRAKQVRYVAEQFEAVLGEGALATAKCMKAQQDHLGALCDAKVNRDLVAGYLARDDLSPTLRDSLASLVDTRASLPADH